jgi:2-polyprenyl-3-methyl-5-hydroxy-6-metoxy-1,4-benzoquinol methylase
MNASAGAALPSGRPPAGADAIWRSETEYFDARAREAAARVEAGVAPEVLARYANPTRPWYNKEYRFRLLGDVAGARVLDVGCGMGENAVLLASRGARVTGVDVSPASIEAARRLASRTPLPSLPDFVCGPLETVDLPEASFDVVWGDGVLHHVLHDLEGVLRRVARFAREGARFVFSEPVDRVPGMRRVRLWLPIEVNGTPNERPLVDAEIALVRAYVPDLRIRAFSFLSRLDRFVVPAGLEGASPARRWASSALTRLDAALLSVGALSRLGGMVVLAGHVRRPAPRA